MRRAIRHFLERLALQPEQRRVLVNAFNSENDVAENAGKDMRIAQGGDERSGVGAPLPFGPSPSGEGLSRQFPPFSFG